ncbi:amidohydrolase [Gelria sp. Kuro-4]|uniref:amidohydrolase n=1 Tax=Gelria sp. Kuro-4 TaxID=2796927 RepID=UPI001BEE233D|nr:amidohydrolase [Gelria sp. Kuro-4]BCV25961.1 peptidase M20 [Gelria sp. Kuro-4]
MHPGIAELAAGLKERLVALRRDLHRYPEPGWTEFRTAGLVVKKLQELGYEVYYGGEVIKEEAMMGVPGPEELARRQQQALEQGADPEIVARMEGGKTGVVAVLDTGRPGPTLGFRFDMDANDVDEAREATHRPFAEGFVSENPGAMHACGHDAHTTIGLGLAEVLMAIKDELKGRIKLVFQPAEEGVRGARAMVEAGVVDDVDYMLGIHVGISRRKVGQVVCGGRGFLATTKLDVTFTGVPAHAGGEPEAGHNALLAAATAALNLHAISRHSQGATRINVGTLVAGSGRNVIPGRAEMKIETRGATTELNDFVRERAHRILQGAAMMHAVEVDVKQAGAALSGEASAQLAQKLAAIAKTVPGVTEVAEFGPAGGSEDYSYFMARVQERGGQATYIILGTEIAAGHHNSRFDINEEVLPLGVKLLGEAAYQLSNTLPPTR